MEISIIEIVPWAVALVKLVLFITNQYSKATRSNHRPETHIVTRSFGSTVTFDIMKETK